jgi:hypothetical protein
VDRDHLHVDARIGEEAAGRRGVGGGHSAAVQVARPLHRRVVCDRELQPAAAEAQRQQLQGIRARLDQLVAPGHGRLYGAVRRPGRDVVGAREQHLDVPLRAMLVEGAAVGLDLDAGGTRQLDGGGVHAALRGQRQAERPAHRRAPRRSSTSW